MNTVNRMTADLSSVTPAVPCLIFVFSSKSIHSTNKSKNSPKATATHTHTCPQPPASTSKNLAALICLLSELLIEGGEWVATPSAL